MTRNAFIRKIRHKSTVNPFTIAGAFIILLTCVPMCFMLADSDPLVLFRNSIRGGTQNYSVVSVFGNSSDQSVSDFGLTDVTPETKLKNLSVDTSYSQTSTGDLNLSLIDKLGDSYVKEMLTLCREMQEGTLYKSSAATHISVSTILGIQCAETGYSSDGVLKAYLPFNQWGKVYGDLSADYMTLKNYGKKGVNVLGSNGLTTGIDYGPFCMEDWGTYGRKSVYNKSDSADVYNYADNLAALDEKYAEALGTLDLKDVKDVNPALSSVLVAISHNRGLGGVSMASTGIAYDPNGGTSSYVKYSSISEEKKLGTGSQLSNLLDAYIETHGKQLGEIAKFSDPQYGRIIAMMLAIHEDNWFLSRGALKTLKDPSGGQSKCLDLWNTLFPEDKKASYDEIVKLAEKRCIYLNEALEKVNGVKVSADDTKRVYRTASDYDDCPYFVSNGRVYGYLYYVSDSQLKAYTHNYSDGSTPFHVWGIDIVCCGESTLASLLGPGVYARLLKKGGLDSVKVTDPSTYQNELAKAHAIELESSLYSFSLMTAKGAESITIDNSVKLSEYLPNAYAKCGIKEEDLTPRRVAVLIQAYELTQLRPKYVWGGGHVYPTDFSKVTIEDVNRYVASGFDCSSFVSWTYGLVGRGTPDFSRFPLGTTSTIGGSSNLKSSNKGDYSKAKPGDILWKSGHVEIFVAKNKSGFWTIGAHSTDNGTSLYTRSDAAEFMVLKLQDFSSNTVLDKSGKFNTVFITSSGKIAYSSPKGEEVDSEGESGSGSVPSNGSSVTNRNYNSYVHEQEIVSGASIQQSSVSTALDDYTIASYYVSNLTASLENQGGFYTGGNENVTQPLQNQNASSVSFRSNVAKILEYQDSYAVSEDSRISRSLDNQFVYSVTSASNTTLDGIHLLGVPQNAVSEKEKEVVKESEQTAKKEKKQQGVTHSGKQGSSTNYGSNTTNGITKEMLNWELDPSHKFSVTGKITTELIGNKDVLDGWFIHYKQGQGSKEIGGGSWWNQKYYDKTMSAQACGACSLSMILSTFVDRRLNPGEIGAWQRSKYLASGTTSYFTNKDGGAIKRTLDGMAPGKFSCTRHECSPYFDDNEFIKTAEKHIRNGGVLICSMSGTASGSKNNLFTLGGHYVVIFDYSKGKFRVGDSGMYSTVNRTRAFSESEIRGACKYYWLIKYKG